MQSKTTSREHKARTFSGVPQTGRMEEAASWVLAISLVKSSTPMGSPCRTCYCLGVPFKMHWQYSVFFFKFWKSKVEAFSNTEFTPAANAAKQS